MMPPPGSPGMHSEPMHQSGGMGFDHVEQYGGGMNRGLHPGDNDFGGPSNFGPGSRTSPPEQYGIAGGNQSFAPSQGFGQNQASSPSYVIIIFVPAGDSVPAPASHSSPPSAPNLQNTQFAEQKSQNSNGFIIPAGNETARFAAPPPADAAGQVVNQTAAAPSQATQLVVTARSPASAAVLTVVAPRVAMTARPDVGNVVELVALHNAHSSQAASLVPRVAAGEGGGGEVINLNSVANLFAEMSSPTVAINLLQSKAVLATIPLNLKGVEQALEHVMSDVQRLGNQFTEWLDENRAAAIALAVTTVSVAGAAGYYLRRRKLEEAEDRDDETSSHWLFVRMQTPSGE